MTKLKLIRILEYYDVPQLFIAADVRELQYLCMLYDIADDGELKVIGVTVSKNKLNDFIKGHFDLLSMFREQETDDSLFSIHMNEDTIYAEPFQGELDNSMLPDEGYYFDDSLDEDEEMLDRAAFINKPVFRIAFETPQNRHEMDARCLSAALLNFQVLVDNSYKKLYKTEEPKNSRLSVTTFQAASFDVEFLSDESPNLFGQTTLGQTFEEINKLFSDTSGEVVETLRKLKGNAVNSYKKFIEVLINNDLSFKLKWVYSTLDREVHQSNIEKNHLKSLYELVNSNSDLGKEEVEFQGNFIAANTKSGLWTFQPLVGKEIKGESRNDELLTGVTLLNQQYKIECEALQFLNETTLKESTKYILNNVSEL